MSRTDAVLLIIASVLIASGVFVISWPAGLIATGGLVWALVLIDRAG